MQGHRERPGPLRAPAVDAACTAGGVAPWPEALEAGTSASGTADAPAADDDRAADAYDDSGCDYWDSGWADETEYVADDGDEVGEEPSDGPRDVLSPCAAQEFTSIFINIPL